MIDPNGKPKGESCNTCSFAGTYVSGGPGSAIYVRCLRYPPRRNGRDLVHTREDSLLHAQTDDSLWPFTTVDDWCGEWRRRRPDQRIGEAPESSDRDRYRSPNRETLDEIGRKPA